MAREFAIEGVRPCRSRLRILFPLNNNRNNRRRGRGNNRSQGGGNQLNRIDSRARGNAPQLLEKYRKLAHDASLNGDRVQAEYYLQFADHYFRVIADGRARQEEQRVRREEERYQPGDMSSDDYDDDYDSAPPRGRADPRETGTFAEEGEENAAQEGNVYEPADNPFIRRASPASSSSRPRANTRRRQPVEPAAEESATEGLGLDPASLPPSIGARDDEAEAAEETKAKPAPRKRAPRRPRAAAAEGGSESLEKAG
jgi:hypothetical protein